MTAEQKRTPTTTTTITNTPAANDPLEEWQQLVRRLKQAGATGAPAILTLRVLVDEYGNPAGVWSVDTCKLEPRMQAQTAISEVLAHLSK